MQPDVGLPAFPPTMRAVYTRIIVAELGKQSEIIPNEHRRRVSGGNSYDEFLMKTGGYPLWRFRLAITKLRILPDYAIQSWI